MKAEQIIKIMGNPTGQRTDGSHLLRLKKLFFHFFLLPDRFNPIGQITDYLKVTKQLAVLVPNLTACCLPEKG